MWEADSWCALVKCFSYVFVEGSFLELRREQTLKDRAIRLSNRIDGGCGSFRSHGRAAFRKAGKRRLDLSNLPTEKSEEAETPSSTRIAARRPLNRCAYRRRGRRILLLHGESDTNASVFQFPNISRSTVRPISNGSRASRI